MTYRVTTENIKFDINKGDFGKAFLALEGAVDCERLGINPDDGLVVAIEKLGWGVSLSDRGAIKSIDMDADVLDEEEKWFDAIAPWVKEGSYIECCGEDMMRWRWYFNGKNCLGQRIKEIIWEDG